jgi:two-component system CheB/CheR fusion protein
VQADDGHWYMMHIMPYRTQKNEMTGLLITFFDIDEKRVLKAALQYTQSIVDTVREPMLILNNEMRIVKANRSFYRVFRTNEEDTRERHIYELGNGQWDIPDLRNLLERIILQNTFFNDYPVEHNFPVIGRRRMILNARRLYEKIGSVRILLAIEDITDKPRMERSFSENSMEKKNDG